MRLENRFPRFLPLALVLSAAAAFAAAQTAAPTPNPAAKKAAKPKPAPPPVFDPKAMDVLKTTCDKLAAAKSMSFTALGAYEVTSLAGPPIIYGRIYEVTLQRPDKLKVVTPGDGPATEFYDDGKVMMSFHPAENLVAVTDAPPTVDAALEKLYGIAGTYFPFTDVIAANPWKDLVDGLTTAFYLGESMLVGGTATDVIAYESWGVFVQMWISKEDKLPRMARAIYYNDPLNLRHSVQFANWQLDPAVAGDGFTTAKAAAADRIPFSNPGMKSDLPGAVKPIGPPKKPAPKPTAAPGSR
jgi:hypothetical protein